ncbi:MAG: bifunctional metallophosphatase/5'-nucleotidase [Deltaproteobacteria bacterium]|nr:bifunctional metallophosphatase/5'-nucleotidase [Deltaproteobacteria bacterium]
MTRALSLVLYVCCVACARPAVRRDAVETPTKPFDEPAAATAPVPDAPYSTKPVAARLTLVHLSDSEAGLLPDPAQPKAGGLARTRALIAALVERAKGQALVLHGGDSFIPAPELSVEVDKRSALLAGNDLLFVAASGLGNHEFDLGESFVAEAIKGAAFPYVTATIDVKAGPLRAALGDAAAGTPWAHDVKGKLVPRVKLCTAMLVDGKCPGLVVGVVGSTTEQLRVLSRGASANLAVPADLAGVRAAVQAQVDALTAEGITVIVLISHLQGIGRDLELAKQLRDVDVVLSAGGENRLAAERHRLLPGDVVDRACVALGEPCYPAARVGADGKPVLLVAGAGDLRYVGNLSVGFDEDGVLVSVDAEASRPWPVDELSLLELSTTADGAALAFQARVVDALAPLLATVAESDVWLEGTREEVRNRQTNLGDLSADSILWAARAARPDVLAALRNGGGIRAPIGRLDPSTWVKRGGPIRLIDVQAALRFDGPLVVVDTTHGALVRTLESALRGAGSGKGHFPQASAGVLLRYTTDAPEQTHVLDGGKVTAVRCQGARVRDLVITPIGGAPIVLAKDGKVSTPDAKIAVATLEYLANGGDGWFPGEAHLTVTAIPGGTEQAALRGFLAAEEAAGRWRRGVGYIDADDARARITPVDGAGVTVPPGCP